MNAADLPAPIVAAFISVCGALIGVYAGFKLGTARDQRAKKEKADAIFDMLETEIQHNLDQLKDWSSGKLPVQSHHIWHSQLEAVPSALARDEIRDVHAFYYNLYCLRKLEETRSSDLESATRRLLGDGNPLTKHRSRKGR